MKGITNMNTNTTEQNKALPVEPTKKEQKLAKKEEKRLKKKKKKEGRRIKSCAPMNVFMPFIMKKRNDACNMFADEFDVSAAEDYIYQKRREGLKGFGMMHLFVAAYVRTVAECPGVNRFIRGQRIMARNNIEIMLTIKREMKLDQGETCVKFMPEAHFTAEEVYHEMNAVIADALKDTDSDFDKTAAFFAKTPRFLLRFAVHLLHFADYYGLLPRFLTKVSPFHGSLFITSMGSLGIPPIYHHIYNFGNVPLFLSFGKVEKRNELQLDGTVKQRRYIPLKVVCDERICDGHHYATFFKIIRHYFTHPELLDTPPAEVKEDIR